MSKRKQVHNNVGAYKPERKSAIRPNRLKTIGTKLFLFFVLSMVVAVITVGLVSYFVSSKAMEEKVSEVAAQSLQQTSEKLDYLLNFYENISLQLTLDQDFIGDLTYRLNLIKAGTTENRMNVEAKIMDKLKQTATTNKVFIQLFDEHLYTQVDTGRDYVSAIFSSGNGTSAISFYEPYFESVIAGNGKAVWLGAIPKGEIGSETVYISMGKMMKTNSGNYLLFIEFKEEIIAEALANLELSSGQLPELINASGELVYSDSPYVESGQASDIATEAQGDGQQHSGEVENVVLPEEELADAQQGEAVVPVQLERRTHGRYQLPEAADTSGSYIEDGQLIVYSTSDRTGWSLIQGMPLAELTQGIDRILTITVILIAGAVAVSFVLGGMIARMISKPIREVSQLMREVERGNLTVRMQSNRSDEIGMLGQSFNQMADNVGSLIARTSGALDYVLSSAKTLQQVSQQMDTSAKEIAVATDEIARGADLLSTQSEEGSVHAASIEEEMSVLLDNNHIMQSHVIDVKHESNRGIKQMQTLLEKTTRGEALTRQTLERAEQLTARALEIGKILELLDNIAKHTNLLSLNAAIEASRAGEHGRGFMVVAKEIRQLADQSRDSIIVVNQIIASIVEDIEGTVQAMNDSYPIYKEQIAVARQVDTVFRDVDVRMNTFVEKINDTTDSVNKLHVAQSTLSEMMMHVSATAEQSTAISEEVASTSNNQLAISSELVQVSQQLHELSQELQSIVSQFQVKSC